MPAFRILPVVFCLLLAPALSHACDNGSEDCEAADDSLHLVVQTGGNSGPSCAPELAEARRRIRELEETLRTCRSAHPPLLCSPEERELRDLQRRLPALERGCEI